MENFTGDRKRMIKRSTRLLGLCFAAMCVVIAVSAHAADEQKLVVSVPSRHIYVSYTQEPGMVTFTAALPEKWILKILVDGNQDQKWGAGPDHPNNFAKPTDDLVWGNYGADYNYQLCAQYVWSAAPGNTNFPRRTSHCGVFPSNATVETSAPDAHGLMLTAYRIPAAEIFGDKSTAHVVIMIWDEKVDTEYFTPSKPLIISKTEP